MGLIRVDECRAPVLCRRYSGSVRVRAGEARCGWDCVLRARGSGTQVLNSTNHGGRSRQGGSTFAEAPDQR